MNNYITGSSMEKCFRNTAVGASVQDRADENKHDIIVRTVDTINLYVFGF
jgi:hypothetical protein